MNRLLFLGLLALAGCHSDLSGPEAERLARALQDPWSDTSRAHLQDLWNRIGGQPFRPDSANPGARLDLQVDGEPLPARAFVFQLVLEAQGPLPAGCQGDRFTLLAWTLQEPSQALILAGGDFSETLAPPQPCENISLLSRRPALSLRPLTGPDGPVTFATAGHASIQPTDVHQGCPFVSREAMAYLRTRGIRCSGGTFLAEVTGTLSSSTDPTGPASVRFRPLTLPGVRWTIDCTQALDYQDLCGPRNPARPSGG